MDLGSLDFSVLLTVQGLMAILLAFLVMIGVTLQVDRTGGHMDKNYIYFALGFSVMVEMLNLRMMRKRLLFINNKAPMAPDDSGK